MKKFVPIALLATLVSSLAFANPLQEELLENDKAFALSTKAKDAQTLEATWKIAPGYYMYRDKFKFEVISGNITLGTPVIPAGKKKDDPTFGVVETYTKSVSIKVPVIRQGSAAETVRLRITSQGCNEPVGVCYPPLVSQVDVKLPAASGKSDKSEPTTQNRALETLGALGRLIEGGSGQQEFLPVDKAFLIQVIAADANTLRAQFQITPGYYLYREKIGFEIAGAEGVAIGQYELPPGEVKEDKYIGRTEVYHDPIEVLIPLERSNPAAATLQVTAKYQGCADKGICYPPTTKVLSVSLPSTDSGATPISTGTRKSEPRTGTAKYVLAMIAAFGTGLLLTFTPCVLPMVPILSSIIVGQGDRNITKLRGGMLSFTYVLGTAVTYTVAGAMAGATGDQLQAYFQNVYAITLFAVLFVLLAMSMFGFYELQMPSFIQSRLQQHSHSVKGGNFVGVFFLGLISALIVGACVSPLLISALGVAITSKDPWLGAAIMFAMSMGMGVFLIALGVGAGYLLPKAGVWMDKVKHVFGVLLLAVAIYFLGILPEVPVLLLWAGLFIVTGVYLGATQPLPEGASGWRFLWKGTGTVLLVWGVLALIGGFLGERDIFRPLPNMNLSALTAPQADGAPRSGGELFTRVTTVSELETELAKARDAGRPVIVDYYASWCVDCVRMEKTTFSDPQVQQALARFALIKADVTENDANAKAVKQHFDVFGPPTMVFLDARGQEIKSLRFSGFHDVDNFLAILRQV